MPPGDTDSSYHFSRHRKLEDNVRPEMVDFYRRTRPLVFVNPDSDVSQAGKMEEEAVYDGGGVFRQNKSYIAFDKDGRKDVKFKGIARSTRELLGPEHFDNPREGEPDPLVSSWRLGPTPAGDLVLNVNSRSLPSRINFKRRTLVRKKFCKKRKGIFFTFFLSESILLDPPEMMARTAAFGRLVAWIRSAGRERPSDPEILSRARKYGVRRSDRSVLEEVKRALGNSARFREVRRPRPARYQRIFRLPFRCIFLDLAFMNKRFRKQNGGNKGFLIAACAHTNTIGAVPFAKKDTEALYAALVELLDTSALTDVVEVLTDGESALRSSELRSRLRRERGIRFVVLSSRSKAYYAERALRYVRTNLSKAMAETESANWTRHLPEVIGRHNRARVRGTKFRRVDVGRDNLAEFMEELYDIGDWHTLPGISRVSDDTLGPRGERAFRFANGESVLAVRGLVGEEGPYRKPSAEGYFSKTVYRVHKRLLATTKDLTMLPSELRLKKRTMSKFLNFFFSSSFQFTD